MMNFHPELAKLASEEHRRRLLAEAVQWRMRKVLQTNSAQGNEPAWLRQRLVDAWCWLTQLFTNQRTFGQTS